MAGAVGLESDAEGRREGGEVVGQRAQDGAEQAGLDAAVAEAGSRVAARQMEERMAGTFQR